MASRIARRPMLVMIDRGAHDKARQTDPAGTRKRSLRSAASAPGLEPHATPRRNDDQVREPEAALRDENDPDANAHAKERDVGRELGGGPFELDSATLLGRQIEQLAEMIRSRRVLSRCPEQHPGRPPIVRTRAPLSQEVDLAILWREDPRGEAGEASPSDGGQPGRKRI